MSKTEYTKRGSQNPKWKGGIFKRGDGRVFIYVPDHPFAINGKYVLRYRLVLEKHLGRVLQPGEVVHHINGNPSDDRIENLQIVTKETHPSLHPRKPLGQWALSYDRCLKCGTSDTHCSVNQHAGNGLCNRCSDKDRAQIRKARRQPFLKGRATGDRHPSRLYPERLRRGEANPKSKLTAAIVLEMRRRAAAGESQSALGREFDVRHASARRAILGLSWAHIK